jgi:hypothetical protein
VEEEVPLELTVDRVDRVHGALRLGGTMIDGSADVSLSLGDGCARSEIGSGIATRVSLTWVLSEAELARALACDLVVHAHARLGKQPVSEVASLSLAPDIIASDTSDGPQLQNVSRSAAGLTVRFGSVGRAARLVAGDDLLGRNDEESADDDPDQAEFSVSYADFARALLSRRPLLLDGASFDTTLAVNGVVVDMDVVADPSSGGDGPGSTDDTAEPSGETADPGGDPAAANDEAPDPNGESADPGGGDPAAANNEAPDPNGESAAASAETPDPTSDTPVSDEPTAGQAAVAFDGRLRAGHVSIWPHARQ